MPEENVTIEFNHGVVATHLKRPIVRVKITFHKDGTCIIPQFTDDKVRQIVVMWRWEWGEGKRYLRLVTKPIGEWKYDNFYFSLPEEEVTSHVSKFLSSNLKKVFKQEFGFKDWT